MTSFVWLPQPIKAVLRRTRDAYRRDRQADALKALRTANERRIIIGSSGTTQPGWVATDREQLDLLDERTWLAYFAPASIDAMLAEHVWEHLTAEQARVAAITCHRFLKPGGYLRVAVPDGLHPDADYIRGVKPPADDHQVLYTHASFRQLFEGAGFQVQLLEYHDELGQFQCREWDPALGMIRRSRRFDPRNTASRLGYTSIVLDASKRGD